MNKWVKISVISYLMLVAVSKVIAASYPNAMFQTDRHCYISGDAVLFKIVIPFHNNESTVYVDVATEYEEFSTGEILKLQNGTCSGYLELPDTLKTGNYLLRCYTYSSMAGSEKQYLCKNKIYITNRFGNNAELYHENNHYNYKIDSVFRDEIEQGPVDLQIGNNVYEKRSLVGVKAIVNADVSAEFKGVIAVRSLSPCEQQCDDKNGTWWRNGKIKGDYAPKDLVINESKGMVISGVAKNKTTQTPLKNLAVIMAFQDTIMRVKYSLTDSLGRFNFLVNDCYETDEIFLTAYSYPEMALYSNIQFSLDNKFATENKAVIENNKIIGYQHSKDSLNLLKSVIAKAYQIDYVKENRAYDEKNKKSTYTHSFIAGGFDRVTFIDDYVKLPDFYQIAKEILPFVRVRERDGRYVFELFDGENHVVRKNPLVFVDGVPLTNSNEIIKWGTDKIERVEVKVAQRFYGDLPFENGIVFIWTKKQDFWETSSCEHMQRFIIPCFQKQVMFSFPNYEANNNQHLPDFRQILYWNPEISISGNDAFYNEFFTSDEAGLFELCLAGVMTDGTPVYIRKYFEVKP